LIQNKQLVLGTAMWGWTVSHDMAFSLLDAFYEAGGRWVDTASNYPINGNAADFGKAASLLSDWLQRREIRDMRVIFKLGSLSNAKVPDCNVSPDYLAQALCALQASLGPNLHTLMLHWDNRGELPGDVELITKTLTFIASQLNSPEAPFKQWGLSGIKHAQVYRQCLASVNAGSNPQCPILLQLKHNPFQSDNARYREAFDGLNMDYLAYGVFASGLKWRPDSYTTHSLVSLAKPPNYHQQLLTPDIQARIQQEMDSHPEWQNQMFVYCLWWALQQRDLWGLIIAPTSSAQLTDTLTRYKAMSAVYAG
jgi:aryl-alcohol dehydrogenase-like predicted oxidoreductase